MDEAHDDKAKRYIRKIGSATFTVSVLSESFGTRGAKVEVSRAGVLVDLDEPIRGVQTLYNEHFARSEAITVIVHPQESKLVMLTFTGQRKLAFQTQSPYETELLIWCLGLFQSELDR